MSAIPTLPDWSKISSNLPPENVVVMTKIHDEHGPRNEQTLKLIRGLWFIPDESMYVYYTPTHWRYASWEEIKC